MNLEQAKSQTAAKIKAGQQSKLNPFSRLYLYTDFVYFVITGSELLAAGGYYPKGDAEMIHDIIIASQSLGSKYHANQLVHYFFVPGRKPGSGLSEAEESFLKTHTRFYGSCGHYGLEAFYQSIGRRLNKPSQMFLEEDVFNIG